jgi:hypothetical protein
MRATSSATLGDRDRRASTAATGRRIVPSNLGPLLEGHGGVFAGRSASGRDGDRAGGGGQQSCPRFVRTGNRVLEFSPGGEISHHVEDAGRGFVARRAAAVVASLNKWRGTLRRAKRRRSSGSVSKSASMKSRRSLRWHKSRHERARRQIQPRGVVVRSLRE